MEGDESYDYIHNFTDNRSHCRYVPIAGHWGDWWGNVGGVWRLYRMRFVNRAYRQDFQKKEEVSFPTEAPSFCIVNSWK